MTPRDTVLKAFREALSGLPVHWASSGTTLGDFEGREVTLDVFDVPAWQQRALLRALRPQREEARRLLGARVGIVFHTPEATSRHHAHRRAPGAWIELQLPAVGGAWPVAGGTPIDTDPLTTVGGPRRAAA